MLRRFRDPLTYPDLAGRRKLRGYVLAALGMLVIVAGIFGLGQSQQAKVQEVVEATPRPVSQAVQPISPTQTPIPTTNPTLESCPVDPGEWDFQNVFPGDNYKRLEPACSYESLAKTVAWHMLEFLGYSKPEAAEMLALTELPWQPVDEITGLTNTRGPVQLLLTRDWPAHPDYYQWTVDADGQPGVVYSLRGCYRARTITGNHVEAWGEYPALCVVALDRASGWVVHVLNEYRFTVDMTGQAPLRRFLLFGYTGASWVLLGEHQDQQVFLEGVEEVSQEREQVTERYDTVPWNAAWLEATFGLTMRPLPEDWQTFGADPHAMQAIATELEQIGGNP